MEEHEVNRLLNRLIDGTISREDFARIQGVMRVSPEVREEYYDLIGVDLMLSENFEMPTHISAEASAMNDRWVGSRSKHKIIKMAVWAAAACVLLSLTSFYFLRDRGPAATLQFAADSRFSINGTERSASSIKSGEIISLRKDEQLEVKEGLLSLKLGKHVTACVEAPARLSLIAQEGKLKLEEGSVFLEITPGGKGFEVHTSGGIIRDVGTKFGVNVSSSGWVETHVTDGKIQIDRGKGPEWDVNAGQRASWNGMTGKISSGTTSPKLFVERMHSDETIFDDDFNESDGTKIHDKKPDIGLPWQTLREYNPSTVVKGVLDTSHGPRSLLARFNKAASTGQPPLYVVSLSTRIPENIHDKAGYPDAKERITFVRRDGGPLFSLVARKSRDHQWQIRNELDPTQYSYGSRVNALQSHDLTLTYDSSNGEVRLYEGNSTRDRLIDTPFKVEPGHSLESILISNDEGGDVSLENLQVRVRTYP